MQEVPLADHTDDPVVSVNHRKGTYAALGHQLRRRLYGSVLLYRNHLARHHVRSAHRGPPNSSTPAERGTAYLALTQVNSHPAVSGAPRASGRPASGENLIYINVGHQAFAKLAPSDLMEDC